MLQRHDEGERIQLAANASGRTTQHLRALMRRRLAPEREGSRSRICGAVDIIGRGARQLAERGFGCRVEHRNLFPLVPNLFAVDAQ